MATALYGKCKIGPAVSPGPFFRSVFLLQIKAKNKEPTSGLEPLT
jgi:hypothetical protein